MVNIETTLFRSIFYVVIGLKTLALYSLPFTALAFVFPSKPSQPLFRRDMVTDALFALITFVYHPIQALLQVIFVASIYSILAANILKPAHTPILTTLPLWSQIAFIIVATDFLQYWTHRLSHRNILWRFHAIHHSSENVDWMSAYRWHPINFLFHVTVPQALVWSAGFSPEAFPPVLLLSTINGCLVHANVKWTYGPLRYVIASPVFHRWHHTPPSQGGEKNFAPFFSVFDVVFGTFYMPEGTPTNFGTPYDSISSNFLGQLAYPFIRKVNNKLPRSAV